MAYLKITDTNGVEHELQVLNEERDILISKEFGKFITLGESTELINKEYEDKIAELETNLKGAKNDVIDSENRIFNIRNEVSIYKERAEEWEEKYKTLREEHS
jgi:hypothetical protein